MDYRNHYKSLVFVGFLIIAIISPIRYYNMLGQGVDGKRYVIAALVIISILFFIQEYKKSKE